MTDRDLEPLRPASTSYKDWVGTAAAETSMITGSGDLYALAGLDAERDRWTILAVDITGHSHGADPDWDIYIYAVDRRQHDVASYNDLKALEAERGSIPVRSILVHGATLDDVVKCMKLVTFQLISPNFPNLDIVNRGDHPPQE